MASYPCLLAVFFMVLSGTFLLDATHSHASGAEEKLSAQISYERIFGSLLSPDHYKSVPSDSKLQKLLKERYRASIEMAEAVKAGYEVGTRTILDVFSAQRKVLESELSLAGNYWARVSLYKKHVKIAKMAEEQAKQRFEVGLIAVTSIYEARFNRLDAELQLLKYTNSNPFHYP